MINTNSLTKWPTCFFCACVYAALATFAAADDKITYDDHVAPIFRQRCGSCHNPTDRKADLDVTNYLNLMQGGASGVVIEAGDASASYLYSLVSREAEPFMPPNTDKIPDGELELLKKWIDGGALENKGSKAAKKKAMVNIAVDVSPGTRPEVIPLPPHLVLEPHFTTDRPPMARSIATSPWAPLVAIAGQRQVLLYDTASLELKGVFPFPEGQPNVVRFSRDGGLLLAGGGRPAASGKVVVWDITTGERVFEIGNELDAVLAADISADHTLVALGGPQRIVRVYSTETGELKYELTKHTEWILGIEFSPDGVLLATSDRNGGLHVWEAHTGNEYLTLNGHTAAVTALTWRGDSNVLASVSEDSSVRLWELENGTQIKTWNSHGGILSAEFARDGRLITCGRDQITRLWDQTGKELIATPAIGELAISASYCDETNRAIAASLAGAVKVYKSEDASEVGELSTNPPTLESRLAAANALLKQKSEANAPLAEALAKSEAELAAVQQSLDASKQAVAELQQQVDALAAQVAQTTSARTANDAERTSVSNSLAQVQAAIPLVSESLRLVTETLAKLPDDAKIVEAQQQLTEKLKSLESSATTSQARIAELAAAISGADAELQKSNAQLETVRKELAGATERSAALESQRQTFVGTVDTARQAAQAASAEVASAEAQVKRWQDEIAFRDQIQSLRTRLDAAQQSAAERQAELDKANEQLAAAQAAGAAAKASLEEAQKSIDQISAEIRSAKGIK